MVEDYVSYYRKLFSELPREESRDYEKQIAKISATCTSSEQKSALQRMIDSADPYAFESFYCLCTVYRRSRDYELMRQLILSHQYFKDRISFNHIVIQYQVHSESMYDYDELLESAYDDAISLLDNAGFLQSFCNAFATICENCNEEDFKSIFQRWFKHALKFINRAITLDPTYAKFYWTKARILSFNGEFIEANRLISQAISIEDSSRPDYFLTILNYQQTKNAIVMRQKIDGLMHRIDQIESLIDEMSAAMKQIIAPKESQKREPEVCPKAYEGNQSFVFVSYAHKDKEEVYSIINELQHAGIRVWYDNGVRAGEEWPDEIGEHLVRSALAIVMLSANSINSKYVRREINLADNESIKILPIVLDNSRLPKGIQLQLGLNQQLLKSTISENRFMDNLIETIKIHIGDE